jgi:hypothetical protein
MVSARHLLLHRNQINITKQKHLPLKRILTMVEGRSRVAAGVFVFRKTNMTYNRGGET